MASEPFIDYKPSWEALGGGTGTPSDSAVETDQAVVTKKVCAKVDDDEKYRTHDALKNRSVVVVNISSALDGCDDQLLPATFRALESDLGFHPSLLGYITLSQTLCLSLFCPFWGYMADRHSRKWLLVFGTASWGCVTTALGLVSEFWQVALLRALNGIFLGSVGPVSQRLARVFRVWFREVYLGTISFNGRPHTADLLLGGEVVGQFAMAVRVPLLIIAYVIVPKDEESFAVFMLLALLVGLSSMAGVAVNRPILADVVRPNHKATVFALTVAVEGSGAAILGAPLVGYLAEHSFGYLRTTLMVADMPEGLRLGNANALASALVFLTAIPWSMSFLLYGILHFTYGKDQAVINTIVNDQYNYSDKREEDMETSITAAAEALHEAEGTGSLLRGESDPDSLDSSD
ncbi:hypothetical protein Emed_005905 [Eimeria media]